jgi:hypothetical protein
MAGPKPSVEDVKREADAIVKTACIKPLEKVAGKVVTNVAVSSESEANQSSILSIHT